MNSDIEAIPRLGGLKAIPLPSRLPAALAIKTAQRLRSNDLELMSRKRRRFLRRLIEQGFAVLEWPDGSATAYRCPRRLNDDDILHLYGIARHALEDTAIFKALEK